MKHGRSVTSAGLAAVLAVAAAPGASEARPGHMGAGKDHAGPEYVRTFAFPAVKACSQDAHKGPNHRHSIELEGRLAVAKPDLHKIPDVEKLEDVLRDFEYYLHTAWAHKGALNIPLSDIGQFHESKYSEKPVFRLSWEFPARVHDTMEKAISLAERRFTSSYNISVKLTEASIRDATPGCGF